MTVTTARHSYPAPSGSDAPAGPAQIKALADSVDELTPYVSTSTPAHRSGLVWRNPSTGLTQMSDGTTWTPIGYTGPRRWVNTRAGASDNFSSGSVANLLTVTLPANAPAGVYMLSCVLDVGASVTATGNLRVTGPDGANLSADRVINPITTGQRTPITYAASFVWAGGTGTITVGVSVSNGTGTVINPGARLDVLYVGAGS